MKVCLFGGSFDPIHIGHQQIVSHLKNDFDEVWVIVSNQSPFKTSHFTQFADRYAMCLLAFANDRAVKVLDVEYEQNFSYTYDTVKYLLTKYDYEFSFAIGYDNYKFIDDWYRIEELKELVNFVVFNRYSSNLTMAIDFDYKISSSKVRITKSSGISAVDNYITKHNLYINDYEQDFANLKRVVNFKRYIHVVNVYNLVRKFAKLYDVDLHKCSLAAIYHDYYRELATNDFCNKYKEQHLKYLNYPNVILHGIIMANEIADFEKFDEEVVEAIYYHSIGKSNCSNVLKVLYLADYLEEDRFYLNEVEFLYDLALEDLDKAYKECVYYRSSRIINGIGMHDDIYENIKEIMEEFNGSVGKSS